MGREVGGGIGMGKTCEPKAFSFQCMTEFTTNKKKKKVKKKKTGVIPEYTDLYTASSALYYIASVFLNNKCYSKIKKKKRPKASS